MIGVCGYGFTGSGAVIDLLKEYDSFNVINDMEFSLPYSPDGLLSLKAFIVDYCARSASSIVAIRRFEVLVKSLNSPRSSWKKLTNNQFSIITKDYIDSIVQSTWKGKLSFDVTQNNWLMQRIYGSALGRVQRLCDRIFKTYIPIVSDRQMKMSILGDEFDIQTKKYLSNILSYLEVTNKETVLNQPFPANKPELVFPFFDSPKAIIVDRDPRDVYLLAKKVVLSEARFMPCNDVDQFIKYYRSIRSSIDYQIDDARILRISFEDLIYEYERIVLQIEKFLGVDEHPRKKQYFKPEISVANTKLFERYSDSNSIREIQKIESELSSWLYDFNNHDKVFVKKNAKSF